MKIAVTYENGEVFQHFGHTENFKIYEAENRTIVNAQVVPTQGSGHGALAGFLAGRKVDVLLCGGIGGGAKSARADAGSELYGGVTGDADDAVRAFLSGTLQYDADVVCAHHEHGHEHGHDCGSHGCGGKCGKERKRGAERLQVVRAIWRAGPNGGMKDKFLRYG